MRMPRNSLPAVLLLAAAGCSGSRIANWDPADYTAASGDTIYTIAWKYELDPHELARWNNLRTPYRVLPGQRLEMQPPEPGASATADSQPVNRPRARPADSVVVDRGDTLYSIARENDLTAEQLAAMNGLEAPYIIRPGQTLQLKRVRPAAGVGAPTRPRPVDKPDEPVTAASRNISWQWPVKGEVMNTFSRSRPDSKGIDIAGVEGAPVKATAPGRVVYSGNGLISYGNLVIIKHNRHYLSAYAHNRRLLVKEGDEIAAGQKIAELGKTGTDSPRLHFEIRKNGKPVDPMSYLPRS